MSNVGYATLSVVPVMKGIQAELNKQTRGEFDRFGSTAGQSVGSTMQREIAGRVSRTNFDQSHFKREGTQAGAAAGTQMKQEIEKKTKGVDLSGLALGLTAGLGGLAVLGKQAFTAFSDQNEAANKVQVVFGAASDSVAKFADGSAKNLGLSKAAALDALGTFGNLFRAMGIGVDTSADMSSKLLQLSADLASFNNVKPEDALIALKAGLVGETEPLRQFGVNLNQARIDAEALRLGLVKGNVNMVDVQAKQAAVSTAQANLTKLQKGGKASATELATAQAAVASAEQNLSQELAGKVPQLDAAQKAQAAYSLIMKDTSLAQGDFARTADGAANKSRILAAQWEDTKAKLGEKLQPIGIGIMDGLRAGMEWVGNWWNEHGPAIQKWFTDTFGNDPWGNFQRGAVAVFHTVEGLWAEFQIGSVIVSNRVMALWDQLQIGAVIIYHKIGPAWEWLGDKVLWFKDHILDPLWGAILDVPKGMGEIFGDNGLKGFLDPIIGTIQDLLNNPILKWIIDNFGGTIGAGSKLLGNIPAPGGTPASDGPTWTQRFFPKAAPTTGLGRKWGAKVNGVPGVPSAGLVAPGVLPPSLGAAAPGAAGAAPVVGGDLVINTVDPYAAARETRRQLRQLAASAVN